MNVLRSVAEQVIRGVRETARRDFSSVAVKRKAGEIDPKMLLPKLAGLALGFCVLGPHIIFGDSVEEIDEHRKEIARRYYFVEEDEDLAEIRAKMWSEWILPSDKTKWSPFFYKKWTTL